MTDVSPEARWLAERLTEEGYVVLVVSALFGGQGAIRSYDFACPPKPRGMRILYVGTYSGGGRGEKGSWRKF